MEDWLLKGLVVFLILLTAITIWAVIEDAKQWEKYAIEHHCKKVGTKASQVGTGFGTTSNGQSTITTVVTPEQDIYACDGGEIRIR